MILLLAQYKWYWAVVGIKSEYRPHIKNSDCIPCILAENWSICWMLPYDIVYWCYQESITRTLPLARLSYKWRFK